MKSNEKSKVQRIPFEPSVELIGFMESAMTCAADSLFQDLYEENVNIIRSEWGGWIQGEPLSDLETFCCFAETMEEYYGLREAKESKAA